MRRKSRPEKYSGTIFLHRRPHHLKPIESQCDGQRGRSTHRQALEIAREGQGQSYLFAGAPLECGEGGAPRVSVLIKRDLGSNFGWPSGGRLRGGSAFA
jgi:hypothetical protein